MRGVSLLLVLFFAACTAASGNSGPGDPEGDPPAEARLEKYEHYIENPTDIVGGEVIVILPDFYAGDLTLEGLGSGWVEEGGKSTWEGSGNCKLELRSLRIQCRLLTVTLTPAGDEPEVLILATGAVSLAQQVKGTGSWFQELSFLSIRNDRMRMKAQ